MPSKTEEYLALAQRTANGLTRYWESWTDYLTTASRLYKYPFSDQLMIFAQRPDATACADYDVWNNRMNRYVRRGAKGIALLDESSGFPRLHYVFDVSDTGVRRNSRDPEVWQYNDDLKQPVSEMLSKTYGISGDRVSQQLADVAGKLVADYWDNNGGDIRAIVDGSLLMDYDEAGVEMQFKSAAAISVTYTLLERCGFEPAGWFDKDDFRAIHEFSTPDSVYALGAAVSDMSREVLRQIERTVKTTIRRRNNERSQHAFIVATHTDREHIHNHIIYNSTALDSTRKFRDFLLSGLAVQRLSDLICLEHQLSVIEIKPYRERQKRTLYPPKESNRDKLCSVIDGILLDEKTANFEAFLQKLEQQGYEIKRGKHTSVKGARQKRFIRFRTLGAGYSEDEIKAVIAGEAEHRPYQKQPPKEQPFHLLVDVQAKLSEGKSEGYARWAKRYNLKEMSKTLIFLQENKIGSIEEMQERVNAATARYHELGDSIKAAEQRMAEIAVLRAHIVNYARTRPVYDAYRKAGYSKKFLEEHREQITLHKAAKAAFDEASLKKLPKVKELDAEYATLLSQKKAAYQAYRKARDEMQELKKAQKNVELFFAEEKDPKEKSQTR